MTSSVVICHINLYKLHFENDRINTPPKLDEPDMTKSPPIQIKIPDQKDKFDNTDLRTVKELEILSRTPDSGILEDQGREVNRGAYFFFAKKTKANCYDHPHFTIP